MQTFLGWVLLVLALTVGAAVSALFVGVFGMWLRDRVLEMIRGRRLRRRMAQEGRVVSLEDIASDLADGTGTLLVEFDFTRDRPVRRVWFVRAARWDLDPEQLMPSASFDDFDLDRWDVDNSVFQRRLAWSLQHLQPYAESACLVSASNRRLVHLDAAVKASSTIAMVLMTFTDRCHGTLSQRCVG